MYTWSMTDPDAQMLYLYLPISLTLIANVVFLSAARQIRLTRLRRLELGAMHHKRHGGSGNEISAYLLFFPRNTVIWTIQSV